MNLLSRKRLLAVPCWLLLTAILLATPGCGGPGKPTVMSFTSKKSQSAREFKPSLDKMKKELAGKVIFKDYDMDDPANKDIIKEYHVTMDPTYIIMNAEGKVKQTFMGKPMEEMMIGAIKGLIPQKAKTPGTAPGSMPAPGVPVPGAPAPTSPSTLQTMPVNPSQ